MALYEINNQLAPIDFECRNDAEKRIVQNAKNLLMCRKGEVPYDRQRGFDPALFFLPIEELQRNLMRELDRVMLWEPNAEVVSGKAERLTDGTTLIRAVIETNV